MQKLLLITVLALVFMSVVMISPAPSPHGDDFKIECNVCHSSKNWKLDPEVYSFDHNNTMLPLTGQHRQLGCRLCHPSLKFKDAGTDCVDCHSDIHEQSVGPDCGRCHTTSSWIVENTTEMHQLSRFPLVGAHYTADCSSCHKSASLLRFEPLGVDCYDCHQQDYSETQTPNHVSGNYSKTCIQCHYFSAFSFSGAGFNHSYFPLTGGHSLSDCNQCHTNGSYEGLSPDCVTCHLTDYNTTTNPNHITSNFPTNCSYCHTTDPGWKPASFASHDGEFFPIYSGKHLGEWTTCANCHPNPANYGQFTCIDCHEHNKSDMDGEHNDVNGYSWNSAACYDCHPRGTADDKLKSGIIRFKD